MALAISTLLQELDTEMADVVDKVRRSLVRVNTGSRGVGAGTVWHSQGLIVTNAHVVGHGSGRPSSAQDLRVTLPDGSVRPARLLARNTDLDVAALMIEADGLNPIELVESRGLRPGQWVVALGHPWGVAGSATGGVVIGSGPDLPEMSRTGSEWIAVGLPLRPGYSGGPLVDARGRMVGLNTMVVGPQVGMAVPVHLVKQFLRRELGSTAAHA